MTLDTLQNTIATLPILLPNVALKRQIMTLLDLTSLNESDTADTIATVCKKAISEEGHVAAVCFYPEFVAQAKQALANSGVKIATVANFPDGIENMQNVLNSIVASIQQGADEIDVVFPYHHYLDGERSLAKDFVRACRKACGKNVILKVILETGAIHKPLLIADATKAAIEAGADFIKTSTGKIPEGATLIAAAVILWTIRNLEAPVGLKVSGGVRTVAQAAEYISLANQLMGIGWVSPRTFRIGASQLRDLL